MMYPQSDFEPRRKSSDQPRFDISFWGIQISGYGVTGIVAAVAVVGMIVVLYRF